MTPLDEGELELKPPLYVIGIAGRMALESGDGLPSTQEVDTDVALDARATDTFIIRAATCRGLLHRRRNTPRQDAYAFGWHAKSGTLLVAVADGVGSRTNSHEASNRVVNRVMSRWLRHPESLKDLIREANDDLRGYIHKTQRAGEMATTLTLMTCSGEGEVRIAWVGDSPVWSLTDGAWTELTKLESSDETFEEPVFALPTSHLHVHERMVTLQNGELFVMTDGVGKALQLSTEVRSRLGELWSSPPDMFLFGAQVSFARESYMDDRTVVGIWRSPLVKQLN